MMNLLQSVSKQVGEALTKGFEVAGVVIAHLYSVLIRQEIVMGLMWSSLGALLLISALVTVKIIKKVYNSKLDAWDKNSAIIICSLIILWLVLSGITLITTWLPHLLNPEYYALQNAVTLLHQIKQ